MPLAIDISDISLPNILLHTKYATILILVYTRLILAYMYAGTSADYSSLAIDISDISLDDEHMCLGSDDESLPNKPAPGPKPYYDCVLTVLILVCVLSAWAEMTSPSPTTHHHPRSHVSEAPTTHVSPYYYIYMILYIH